MKLQNKRTGEIIVEVDTIGLTLHRRGLPTLGVRYDSLAKLKEEWEEYKPAEPLIKDEKIRKAVRAWAEALNASEVSYNSCAEYSEGRFEAEMGMADIDFGQVIGLEDGNYTIAELCGEEEE